jgi:hypothetical protein
LQSEIEKLNLEKQQIVGKPEELYQLIKKNTELTLANA